MSRPLGAIIHIVLQQHARSPHGIWRELRADAVRSVLPQQSHRHPTHRDDFTGIQLPDRLLEADSSLFTAAQRKLSRLSQCQQPGRDRGDNRIVIRGTQGKRSIQDARAAGYPINH
jgi:hypothetical protein